MFFKIEKNDLAGTYKSSSFSIAFLVNWKISSLTIIKLDKLDIFILLSEKYKTIFFLAAFSYGSLSESILESSLTDTYGSPL